jgi:LysM repeat protein
MAAICGAYLIYGSFLAAVHPEPNKSAYAGNYLYVMSLKIPKDINFCGEVVPDQDIRIRNKIEQEFYHDNYWKSNALLLFNRAKRWFPYIEPILKKNGVPADFKYLAVIESHLSNVTSSAGAAGFWQLLPQSARNYGLEVNELVDERYHVEKSTEAACKHILDAYKVFHNWTLAAAAYNLGIGGLLTAFNKQKAKSYYDLSLNSETGSFVYRILAYKTLLSNPSHFGIRQKSLKPFPKANLKTVKIDSTVHSLYDLATKLNTSFDAIKCLNPWLRGETLPNAARKNYILNLPSKSGLSPLVEWINDINPVAYQPVKSIEKSRMKDSLSLPSTPATTTVVFTVRLNESVSSLAKFLNVTEEELRKWNSLGDKTEVVTGQTLTICRPSH